MILTVTVTLVSIAIAAALPVWSHFNQREMEEELIFRGLQYAEAIRVFQIRTGRLPNKLEELIKVEPRSIRQLYPNPMSKSGTWGKIYLTGGSGSGPGVPGEFRRLQNQQNNEDNDAPRINQNGDLLAGGREGETGTNLPIRGVYSPEGDETIKTWFGSNSVRDWQFTPEILQAQRPSGSASNPTQSLPVNAGQIGRPLPPGIQQIPGGLGGGGAGAGGSARELGNPGNPGNGGQDGGRGGGDGGGPQGPGDISPPSQGSGREIGGRG